MKTSPFVIDHRIEGYENSVAWVKVRSGEFTAEGEASGKHPHIAYTKAMQVAGRRLRKVIALAKSAKVS